MIRALSFPIFIALLGIAACCKEEIVSFRVFREISSPVTADCSAVWMADSLHGIVAGGTPWQSGFILSTADGGQTWQTDTLLDRKMEDVMFDRTGQGYVCGQDRAFFRPLGNQHWQIHRTNYAWNKTCFFPDDRHGVMISGGGYSGSEIATFGSDAFWRVDTLQNIQNALADVWFSDSATVHAVGIGWVLRSADAGRSWQRYDVTGDFFQSVQFPTSAVGYICGSSGTILKTTDSGLSWQTIREGGSTGKRNQPFRALWFVNAETGFLVGDNGLFWRTENGGADWAQVQEAPAEADFTGVFALNDRGWAVARGGRIFYFER